jgi:hypothetical protein
MWAEKASKFDADTLNHFTPSPTDHCSKSFFSRSFELDLEYISQACYGSPLLVTDCG